MWVDKERREKSGEELFYLDKNDLKQDAGFHDEILKDGRDDPDDFDALLERLGLIEAFAATFSDAEE